MIMIGHYIGIVKYSQDVTCFPLITWLNGSLFSTIVDEGFWLQLFFVISGFLLSYAKITNSKGLAKRIAKRFFRFYLPILAACFLIYILAITIGFHNGDTTAKFTCQWYQSFYSGNITILDLVTDPIRTILIGGSKFNSPYWVIKNMYLSSVLIYAISFISRKVGDKRFFNILIYVLIILVSGIVISPVISACLTGALCGLLLKYFKLHIEKTPQKVNNTLCVLCILFPFGLHNILYSLVVKCFDIIGVKIGIVRYLAFRDAVWGVLYFALLILLLSSNNIIRNALSCKALRKLNQFSFGIYSFHWPLICSIGALIMIAMPLKNGIIVAWAICIIITFAVSIIYHFIFEKNINRLLNKYF